MDTISARKGAKKTKFNHNVLFCVNLAFFFVYFEQLFLFFTTLLGQKFYNRAVYSHNFPDQSSIGKGIHSGTFENFC